MIIKAPNKYVKDRFTIFMAGAIDMGSAINWQETVEEYFPSRDVLLLNPRRSDWDSTWKQEASNPQFREQVEWELKAQEDADLVLVVFPKDSKAPITLLELGIFHKKAIVCVEAGFYRKGNIDIICDRYSIPRYESLKEMLKYLLKRVRT